MKINFRRTEVKKIKILVLLSLIFYQTIFGQESKSSWKKHSLSFLQTTSINLIVWMYDWYIEKRGWANISIYSIKNNLKTGYLWGNNSFLCDQLEHPFHGSQYFASARINQLNFWESSIYPFLGSAQWEFLFENCPPALNDGLMTSLSGIILGESLHRLASLITSNQSGGLERVFREMLTFFINPTFEINRLIKGEAWKKPSGEKKEKIAHYFSCPLGFSLNKKFQILIETTVSQKEIFNNGPADPYDYFDFQLRLRLKKNFKIERVISSGWLSDWLLEKKPFRNNVSGYFSIFEYINTPSNKISSVGIGPGFYALNEGISFKSGFFFIFGGSTSSIARYRKEVIPKEDLEKIRPGYDPFIIGWGFTSPIKIELKNKSFGSSLDARFHFLKSAILPTTERVLMIEPVIKIDLDKFALEGRMEYFYRSGTYRHSKVQSSGKNFYFFIDFKF